MVGPRDHRLAGLERLAQRIEHLRVELRAARRGTARRDGRARLRPAAVACRRRPAPPCSPNDAARGTGASCRCAPPARSPAKLRIMLTSSISARRERRQDRGQPLRQHRLARAGRPDHQQIVPAGRRDFERALGRLLALDVAQVGHGLDAWVRRRQRAPQRLQSLEVIDQLQQICGARIAMSAAAHAASAPQSRDRSVPCRARWRRSPREARRRWSRSSRRAPSRRARNSLRSHPGRRRRSPPSARARWEGRNGSLPSAGRPGRD